MKLLIQKLIHYLLLLILTTLMINCAGVKPQADWTASQYFEYAMKKYQEEDYYDAANEFTVVTLRYAGSAVADSAQYYLGLSHYHMDEYLIAAAEFEKLINNMSRSPLVAKAIYQLGKSYYQLSPRSSLDQEYTEKSIRAFQLFIEQFPAHELKDEAQHKINDCRNKLAKKKYDSAQIYRKMHEYKAAILYFEQLLNEYYDSVWADNALLAKIETELQIDDYQAARNDIEKFKEQFPKSELLDEVRNLENELLASNE
ncbi:MAG: outer membrane protein assembly factor BamD [Caldithrix sp.]|nr:outer membrane protein assembly factor BamD [Caldithrix sp.]